MPEPEDHHLPDVSTEPQRQALDEMSQSLVDSLNDMVREQQERAELFAQTRHSLSPQPEPPETPPPATPPRPGASQKRRKAATPPPLVTARPTPENMDASALSTSAPRLSRTPGRKAEAGEKNEETGCGSGPLITLIIIIVIIVRSCT